MTAPACHATHPGVSCTRTAPGGYCLPPRCYCGGCDFYRPDTAHAVSSTVLDERAIASGQRRSGASQYRAAQNAIAARRDRDEHDGVIADG